MLQNKLLPIMKRATILFLTVCSIHICAQQSAWEIKAENIDPNNYYGITVANGVVGIVSSAQPMKIEDVVLNGAYDYYQRGRVSNILKTFNHMNMDLDIDNQRISAGNIKNFSQTLNMKEAYLKTSFDFQEKASVETKMLALRNLPYTSMIEVTVIAHDDINISPISEIVAPNHLKDVRNY